MPADGEKPFHGVAVDGGRGLSHEFDECVLDHIARPLGVTAEQAGRVADERSLLLRENAWQKTGVFMSVFPWTRGWIGHGVHRLDAPPRPFLGNYSGIAATDIKHIHDVADELFVGNAVG